MKHSLKNPQKKSSCYVSYIEKPIKISLNEIKINKFFNNGYKIECHLPLKINDQSISIIEELDNISLDTLRTNHELFRDVDILDFNNIDNIYNYSYLSDISSITLTLNNKTDCYFNGINKYFIDIIEILKDVKRLKDYNINVEISFLGLFIYENMIINKWIVKTLNIEELMEDFSDWNKIDIETDWENEINNYENDINEKIQLYNKSLANAKILLEEIKNETNFNIWDKKILKLKKQIIKI
jgi:hypothetical protein